MTTRDLTVPSNNTSYINDKLGFLSDITGKLTDKGLLDPTAINGVLGEGVGGTGESTYTDGQLLIGNGTTKGLDRANLTAGTNVTITNAAGSITIAAAGSGNVSGPASSTNNDIAVFNGVTGQVIKDGGKGLPTGAVVGTTDSQTLSSKTLTTPVIADFTNATHAHQSAAGGGTLSAAAIASGQLALARGGTGADLSATGGASQVLRQSSVGGVVTVSQLAAGDVSGLAASATTDTTNAANISSGTLPAGRMPALTGDVTTTVGTVATTIANAAVTLAKMANMATASVFYRKTAGSGAPEVNTLATLKTDLGLTGTNSGDQTISLTGDVTGSGTGSFAATIAANAVTDAKFRQSAGLSVVGRSANTTGNTADITGSANQVLRVSGTTLAFGTVDVGSAMVSGIMGSGNGGTGNGFAKLSGPATTEKTFTLPNASATVLTDNALVTLAQGGTNANLTASNGGILYSTASAAAILSGTATANKVLMSGASAAPVWSTPTFPNASATSGKTIRSDGTNWIASTATLSDAPSTSGKVLISDGTNWITSTVVVPNTTSANQILYSSAANTVAEITAAANSILVTNASNVPSLSTTTWSTRTFSAGNFTANGSMTWTVASGNVTTDAYVMIGKTMVYAFKLASTSVGGSLNTILQIKLPNSVTANRTIDTPCRIVDAGTASIGWCEVGAAGTNLLILRTDGANWSSSSSLTQVSGVITFEVQ